ncbi:DUF1752-domain-containing protein [Lasiosphaeris hirsuta]|uniref:DUF1752-domain-containing protein n=1 Tax=Lasiosphaeris hirsuta TaxID=260670 RepID=A0AA40A2Q3_9PEZI|nr:DUF1752-domain-containing protein [Lasiosphaeris hirsuta]
MPLSLETPVLQVDANVIHKVDTTNPENLFSMWTVFARCRDSVAQGRRLENLSWRLWNRETFCCESGEAFVRSSAIAQPKNIHRDSSAEDIPQLSGSVDSASDEEAVDFTSESAPLDILRPRILRQDSCASSRSRGRERHITSGDLEKMVVSIVEAKVPLNAPLPSISHSPQMQEKPAGSPEPEHSGSTTTESPCQTSETPSMDSLQTAAPLSESALQHGTIVTLGFSPVRPVRRITSQVSQAPSPSPIPEPTDAPAPKPVQPKKQPARFEVGGSSGSGEDSYSDRSHVLEARKQLVPQPKRPMFQVGRESSEAENSLKSALHPARQGSLLTSQKKTASFSNQVVTQTYASAISDGEQSDTDYVDESAIDDDDDSSDWEDSVEDSGKSSVEEKFNFQRVDSKVNLTSRRSLITLMLAQTGRAQRLGNNASQSTSALPRARSALNGPSLVASPNDSDEAPLMMKRGTRTTPMRPITEVPRTAAQPINATATIHHQAALSPRTTRRNMLATELTESLRRQLLWERSQKSSTANAVLKRRHTSHDVANLKQYPEQPCMKDNDANASSWNQYFNKNNFTGYHAQGW